MELKMDLEISNKVALVTAGSKGIGFACVQALLAEGVKVAFCSRSQDNIKAALQELSDIDQNMIFAKSVDTQDIAAMQGFLTEIRAKWGNIELLVANSGGPKPGTVLELDNADYQKAFESNFLAYTALTNEVLKDMKKQNYGRIIYTTSSVVAQPLAILALSNAIRSALTSYSKTLANEVGKFNISVNCVMPGKIDTDRLQTLMGMAAEKKGISKAQHIANEIAEVPFGRLGKPAEIAALITFLCSNKAAYVSGSNIAVDGAYINGLRL